MGDANGNGEGEVIEVAVHDACYAADRMMMMSSAQEEVVDVVVVVMQAEEGRGRGRGREGEGESCHGPRAEEGLARVGGLCAAVILA